MCAGDGHGQHDAYKITRSRPAAPGMQPASSSAAGLAWHCDGLQLMFEKIAALGLGGVVVPLVDAGGHASSGRGWGQLFFGSEPGARPSSVSARQRGMQAAAAIAVSSVVRTDDKQTAVAVATVVLFGTVGMLLYPWLYALATQHWHPPRDGTRVRHFYGCHAA